MGAESSFSAAARVLVVDDDRGHVELVELLLRAAGFEPVVAFDGRAALDAARAARPDLALLDVNLPGLSGYEVCRALRLEHGPSLPVMFLSGDRTESFDRVAGLLLGADDYLVKPFAADELIARVRALLRRSAPAGRVGALTAREREVLALLADGLDQREIARRLVISSKTCAKHIERILEKLKVHSRAQAVALAYREELVAARR